jgi:hypothetical protein
MTRAVVEKETSQSVGLLKRSCIKKITSTDVVKNKIPDINTCRINSYLDLNIPVVFVHVLNVAVLKCV